MHATMSVERSVSGRELSGGCEDGVSTLDGIEMHAAEGTKAPVVSGLTAGCPGGARVSAVEAKQGFGGRWPVESLVRAEEHVVAKRQRESPFEVFEGEDDRESKAGDVFERAPEWLESGCGVEVFFATEALDDGEACDGLLEATSCELSAEIRDEVLGVEKASAVVLSKRAISAAPGLRSKVWRASGTREKASKTAAM
jgi:hypothetical protein